jgi:hypothetical protein
MPRVALAIPAFVSIGLIWRHFNPKAERGPSVSESLRSHVRTPGAFDPTETGSIPIGADDLAGGTCAEGVSPAQADARLEAGTSMLTSFHRYRFPMAKCVDFLPIGPLLREPSVAGEGPNSVIFRLSRATPPPAPVRWIRSSRIRAATATPGRPGLIGSPPPSRWRASSD